MDKIRLLTDGMYGEDLCKPGDILVVVSWEKDGCNAYISDVNKAFYFYNREFEKIDVEGLYVVVYDDDSIEAPVDYDNALFIWQTYVEEGYDARIAKLTWLD